jgi:Ca2+-binding EF-hand superfamily protein
MITKMGIRTSAAHAAAFHKKLPTDRHGKVGFNEFCEFVLENSS